MLMRALFFRQRIEQLADAKILAALRRLFIEAACFFLHGGGLLAYDVEPERTNQPDGTPFYEALYVFATQQRDVFAKALAIGVKKTVTVADLFLPHAFENLRGRREAVLQALREIGIDARVFFFQRDGKGQDFFLG